MTNDHDTDDAAKQQQDMPPDGATPGPSRNDDATSTAAPGTASAESPSPTVSTTVSTSYFDLLRAVVIDPSLRGDQKVLLLNQLKGIAPTSDRFTYRTAIWILGFIALTTIIALAMIYFTGTSAEHPPEGLIAIASGAVGGLSGVLSTTKGTDSHSP